MKKIVFCFVLILSFGACDNVYDSSKVPIGYKKYDISLGDTFKEVNQETGDLVLNSSPENSDLKSYFTPFKSMVIGNTPLNTTAFFLFNDNRLVGVEAVYSVHESAPKPIDFESLVHKLAQKDFFGFKEVAKDSDKTIINHDDLWLRRISVDTISNEITQIRFLIQAIP